ncbi:MAG: histidine triad nucleotide-binding protein [Peptostreptococcaceae bacterium]|nr:histidine triad nucleotide-binding protein [Peptostreptococcaceae bacterium]
MDCLFCKIINGDIPSNKVYENDKVLAFRDIAPQAPSHIVIIPKEHYSDILDIPADSNVMNDILNAVKEVAKIEGIEESGFRLVNNCKSDGQQTVFHVHFHMLGRRQLTWPPG